MALATALGVGLWLSALNVTYRDARYTIPFLQQFWLFATPVAYSSSLVPKLWRALYGLNPMAGVVDGFRWAVQGKAEGPGQLLAFSIGVVVALLIGGLVPLPADGEDVCRCCVTCMTSDISECASNS